MAKGSSRAELASGVISLVIASLGIALVSASAFLTWTVLTGAGPGVVDLIAKCLPSLVGAAAGAGLAFGVAEFREKRKEQRDNAAAAGLAIVKLGRMYSAYFQFDREVLERMRKHPLPWYATPPGELYPAEWDPIDLSSLQFLLRSKEPEIVSLVALEELRFLGAKEMASRRTRMHQDEMQPRVEAKGLDGNVDLNELLNAIGPRIRASMLSYTTFLQMVVPQGERESMRLAAELRRIARTVVGDEPVVGIAPGEYKAAER